MTSEEKTDSTDTTLNLKPRLPSVADGLLGSLLLPALLWPLFSVFDNPVMQWLADHMRWTQFLYLIPYMGFAYKRDLKRPVVAAAIGMTIVFIFGQDYVRWLTELVFLWASLDQN